VLSHVTIGANDPDTLIAFYDRVLAPLGIGRFWRDDAWGAAGWRASEGGPGFYVGRPFDRAPATPGNGVMVAFVAPTRDAVDAAWQAALDHGGSCAGRPGLRPQYGPDYYGAYMRDPEGNKLHAVHRGG
jgi:catechol 2,3-dioxygenase-like lactoylglutathione lyase family enzyme